jgi:hypothetical protein
MAAPDGKPAPGDGEVTVVTDETMGEKDPLLAKLLAAAPAGAEPAGPLEVPSEWEGRQQLRSTPGRWWNRRRCTR